MVANLRELTEAGGIPEFVDANEIAAALGVSSRTVSRRADRESWPHDECPTRGGRKRMYVVDYLPPDVQAAVLAPYRRSAVLAEIDTQSASDLAQVTDTERDVAAERSMLLDELAVFLREHASELGGRTKATKQWAAERGLSPATLYRWRKARKKHGAAGLCRRYSRQGSRADWPEEAKRFFRALWLDENQPSQQWAIKRLRFRALKEGWDLPGERTLRRYLDSIPAPVRILLREGPTAFRTQCLPYLERDYDALEPNQIWTSDHCRLDVFVRDAESGDVFRPWITGWQDLKSRRIPGSMLCRQPSSDTISATFVQGARKFGLPDHSYTDNGRDYSSKRMAGGQERFRQTKFARAKLDEEMQGIYTLLGVTAVFARPAHGQAKAIERFFSTHKMGFEKSLPAGYVGRSPAERPEDAHAAIKAGKVLDFDLVKGLWAEWVDDVYHRTPHTGQGMRGRTPNEVWNAWLAEGGAPRVASSATLALLLQEVREVKLQRQGVRIAGRHFWTAELLEHADLGDKLVVRFDSNDLSQVWVFTQRNEFLCTAPLVERTAYLDKEAPAAGRSREKAVEQLTEALVKEVREDRAGMDVRELVLGVVTHDEGCETADVVQPVRTEIDGAARSIAKRSGATKAERAKEKREQRKARERAEKALMAAAQREEEEPAAPAAFDPWAVMARVAESGGLD